MISLTKTADGSSTFYNDEIGEHYHSVHGALQESQHVFIQQGLSHFHQQHPNIESVNIFEVGFGTGLNFLLSVEYCTKHKIHLYYTGIEAYPLSKAQIQSTNYQELVNPEMFESFVMHYPETIEAETDYSFSKKMQELDLEGTFDIVYFDAFAPLHQAEMWEESILQKCADAINPNGIFVTYSITGRVKRFFSGLSFLVEKPPGANHKREMFRAIKHV
jgi:tRNA U34 5-methylaminomethyl-2-thiouridine-forming methyltransferase MnmC